MGDPQFPTASLGDAKGPALPEGARIGPYRIREVLGEGGMGVVYLAEQEQPIARRVALKVVKQGMDTQQFIRRFESERQALALMNHPAIARVFDAGSTDDGRPYFAMEHVAGLPLVAFCDQHRLDNRERLTLFMAVCQAVQHAHQKGIIHRDLKPSNILVAMGEDGPAPKVIDFGVAKAMDQRLGETAVTRFGAVVGTPEYMSPEQAESGLDVDTTSDIYSLGVVLYQLLVGSLPFDPEALRRAGQGDLPRLIRGTAPVRPSTRVGTRGDEATDVASRRRTDVASLRRELRGDLDWIVLKAMEKDRGRRYAAASELAADIGRHLAGQPILARPPSVRYRLGKFVSRHRVGVAAGVLIAFALVAGIIGTSAGLVRARRAEAEARRARATAEGAAAQARAVNNFLVDVLGAADSRQQGRDVKVVDALAKALQRVESDHTIAPSLEAAVRNTLGNTYTNLGDLDRGEEQIRKGLEIRRRVLGPEDPDTLTSMSDLLAVLQNKGRLEEAIKVGRETLALRTRVLGADHPDTTTTMNDLGIALNQKGDTAESEALLRATVGIRERVLGPEDPKTLVAMSNLGGQLSGQGKLAEAEALTRGALESQRRILGPDHSNTLYSRNSLAGILSDEGKLEEAEPLYREALESSRRVSGPQQIDTLIVENDFALLLMDRGKLAEAEDLLRDGLRGATATLPKNHRFLGFFRRNLGRILTKSGRYPEAEAELMAAQAVFRSAEGDTTREMQGTAKRFVELYEAWGKPAKAAAYRPRLP